MHKQSNPPQRILMLLLASAFCTGAFADDGWETVMRDRNRQVQIDRASIIPSDGGTKVAWGRLVMAPSDAAAAGYTTVQALNRYDCVSRSIVTVKRRYLDARNIVVREENVIDPRPVLVRDNTVDERLWREVCRPPSVDDLGRIADEAGRVVASLESVAVLRPAAAERAGARVEPAVRPAFAARDGAPGVPPRADAGRASVRDVLPATAVRRPAELPAPGAGAAAAPASTARVSPGATRRAPNATATGIADWSYAGDAGPEHWAKLRPDWALCASGTRQSPVDLRDGITVDLAPVLFDYRPTRFLITDTGKTLEVRVGAGMGAEIRGERFELMHFQFHTPAEIRIDGRAADLGLHLHHRNGHGELAIIAIALDGGGAPQPLIQSLLNNLPLDRGAYFMPLVAIDLADLLPASAAHYLYLGSLTTPPCTEGVTWVVMKEPLRISNEQLAIFRRLYPGHSRPVQPLNERLVLESR